jgi:hypothetical protein
MELSDKFTFVKKYQVGVAGDITGHNLSITNDTTSFYVAGSDLLCGNSKIVLDLTTPQNLLQEFDQTEIGDISLIQWNKNETTDESVIYMCIYDASTNSTAIQQNNLSDPSSVNILDTFLGNIVSKIIFIDMSIFYTCYYAIDGYSFHKITTTTYSEMKNVCAILPPNRGIRILEKTFLPKNGENIFIQFGSNSIFQKNACIHLFYDGNIYRHVGQSGSNVNLICDYF